MFGEKAAKIRDLERSKGVFEQRVDEWRKIVADHLAELSQEVYQTQTLRKQRDERTKLSSDSKQLLSKLASSASAWCKYHAGNTPITSGDDLAVVDRWHELAHAFEMAANEAGGSQSVEFVDDLVEGTVDRIGTGRPISLGMINSVLNDVYRPC